MKPLLNGKAMADALDIRPGRVLGRLVEEATAWQLEHPMGVVDDLIPYLKSRISEIEHSLPPLPPSQKAKKPS
jgi:hypothetical protein